MSVEQIAFAAYRSASEFAFMFRVLRCNKPETRFESSIGNEAPVNLASRRVKARNSS
jgi:hypothetical protein